MKVKKYNNRKLYFDGKYINLTDIITAIKAGEFVEIISHDTGLDVTEETLKEALKLVTVDLDVLLDLLTTNNLIEVKGVSNEFSEKNIQAETGRIYTIKKSKVDSI